MDYPLISVLVLCYNNQKYIYENLMSIFTQTYPNIEVLISDDASSVFDAEQLVNWINLNKTSNIKKISIFENRFNVGTVASLENIQKSSSGEFLFNIAADDVLFDENVLMNMYQRAKEVGEFAQIIVSETELWDESLKNKIGDFLKDEGIKKIKESTPLELFVECSWHAFFPACYLYKRNLLDVVGELTGKYRLVEDWATQLIVFREGIKPYYCDIRSSIKHRDGGISHGNSLGAYEASLQFYRDFHEIYANEIEPYLGYFNEKERFRTQTYAQDRFRAYYKIHLPKVEAILNKKFVDNDRKDEKSINKDRTLYEFLKDKISYASKVLFSQKIFSPIKRYIFVHGLVDTVYTISNKKTISISMLITMMLVFGWGIAYYNDSFWLMILSFILLFSSACFTMASILLHVYLLKK